MTQPLTAEDPRVLGVYELLGRLGEGAQGVVYLGRTPAGEQVAIKLLHPGTASDPVTRERFLREVAVARRVARFCTAPVLHADLEGSRPYVVSEYIPGPSLRTLVEREGPRRGAALERLAISTATALASIHRAGVLHRDFKPANVLIGPEGPVVIDFGIAKAFDQPGSTRSGMAMGTPSYLAPEVLGGQEATPASDVFSWGVTMVFAATARPAFGNDSIPSVITRILHEEPDLSLMEPPLRDLVAACLAKDPAARPTAEQLVTHLTGQPAPPPPVPAPRPAAPRTPGTRRGIFAGIAAVAAALVLAAGTVVFAQTRQESAAPARTSPAAQAAGGPTGQATAAPAPPSPTHRPRRTRTPGARRSAPPEALPQREQPEPTATRARRRTRPNPTGSSPAPSKPPASEPPPSESPTSKPPTSKPPTAKPTTKPTSQPKPSPKPNPYTAAGVCGSGYKVIDSHSFGSATTYLLYHATAKKNCVITLSRYVVPGKIAMSAVLQVQGGGSGSDSGKYTAYAGPIRLAAAKKCVIWGGGYGSSSWRSGWSHCG
ncbi:serine/threonine-protein kinase [Thermopolyspora sp. NPDC052614]|uniref:serine/threonine-protein kinase n=1 Tax=Thermopolyspora sp. NPDC052614 TaxID=3155682 RepID=UPI0034449E37